MIDRTNTLRTGIPYLVLHPVPQLSDKREFDAIADAVGQNILRESLASRRHIQVLWSGGIDSTVAVIALSKAAFNLSLRSRIQIVCSAHSVREYPRFFEDHITNKFSHVMATPLIGDVLDDRKLIVTSEHGDQLFGSVKFARLVSSGEAGRPYRTALPKVLMDECGSEKQPLRLYGTCRLRSRRLQ